MSFKWKVLAKDLPCINKTSNWNRGNLLKYGRVGEEAYKGAF